MINKLQIKNCKYCNKEIYKKSSESKTYWTSKEFCSMECNNKSRIGKKHSIEHKQKISKSMQCKQNSLGTKRSLEFKQNLSNYWKDNPNHNHWVDGKGYERKSIRIKEMGRLEYRQWRLSVFKRDKYTCVLCNRVGDKLHADHIKSYSKYPDLRLDINNGRTLCVECHRKTPNYGSKKEID